MVISTYLIVAKKHSLIIFCAVFLEIRRISKQNFNSNT